MPTHAKPSRYGAAPRCRWPKVCAPITTFRWQFPRRSVKVMPWQRCAEHANYSGSQRRGLNLKSRPSSWGWSALVARDVGPSLPGRLPWETVHEVPAVPGVGSGDQRYGHRLEGAVRQRRRACCRGKHKALARAREGHRGSEVVHRPQVWQGRRAARRDRRGRAGHPGPAGASVVAKRNSEPAGARGRVVPPQVHHAAG